MIDPDRHVIEVPWLVLDFEFSGMRKGETRKDDHIIEVAMIKYHRGKPTDKLVTLLDIGSRTPTPYVSRMTGIRSRDLKGKPTFKDVASRIYQMFDDDPLVIAQNARNDLMMLSHEFLRIGGELQITEYICTYQMALSVFSQDKIQGSIVNHRLGTLCDYCGIDLPQAHRAFDDTKACAHLFVYMLKCLTGGHNDPKWVKSEVLKMENLRRYGYSNIM